MTPQELIKLISKETNKNKLDYSQLRYLFREVRKVCNINPSKEPDTLFELPTQEELSKFYSLTHPLHKLIFKTLEGTGLRISELCNLELKDIDFANNRIFVRQGKGSKDRYTYLGNRLKEQLLIYLHGKHNRYLFESIRSTKFSPRTIQHFCKLYKEKAHITKRFTAHTFRHIFCTTLAENGISAEHRSYLAGHNDIDSQKIYTHITAGGIKDRLISILDKENHGQT